MIDKKGRNITHNYITAELDIEEDNQNIRITVKIVLQPPPPL